MNAKGNPRRITNCSRSMETTIIIEDDGTVLCGPNKDDRTMCCFWSVWGLGACCGNCPLVKFGEMYYEMKLIGTL